MRGAAGAERTRRPAGCAGRRWFEGSGWGGEDSEASGVCREEVV